jgi:shikimate 5-dehydrogenase
MDIDVATRLMALLGDPVEHSLSPRFQNAAFQAARHPRRRTSPFAAMRTGFDGL